MDFGLAILGKNRSVFHSLFTLQRSGMGVLYRDLIKSKVLCRNVHTSLRHEEGPGPIVYYCSSCYSLYRSPSCSRAVWMSHYTWIFQKHTKLAILALLPTLLPPANEVWGKVMFFLHLSVILFTEGSLSRGRGLCPGWRGVSVQGGLCHRDPHTVMIGRSAFYWNAFSYSHIFTVSFFTYTIWC